MHSHDNLSPIDLYLKKSRTILRLQLPNDRMESVLNEARDHMEQVAESLIEDGKSKSEAELSAVKAFGGAWRWANDVVAAFYSDKWTKSACHIATGAFTLSVVVMMAGMMIGAVAPSMYHRLFPHQESLLGCMLIFAVVYLIASFRARQIIIKPLIAMTTAAAVVLFLCYASTSVLYMQSYGIPRAQAEKLVANDKTFLASLNAQYELLKLGKRAYLTNTGSTTLPALLGLKDHYLVPTPFSTSWYAISKRCPPCAKPNLVVFESPFLSATRNGPPEMTATTLKSAKRAWQEAGINDWMVTEETVLIPNAASMLNSDQRLLKQPRFNPAAANTELQYALEPIMTLGFLGLLAACIGRVAFRFRRRNDKLASA